MYGDAVTVGDEMLGYVEDDPDVQAAGEMTGVYQADYAARHADQGQCGLVDGASWRAWIQTEEKDEERARDSKKERERKRESLDTLKSFFKIIFVYIYLFVVHFGQLQNINSTSESVVREKERWTGQGAGGGSSEMREFVCFEGVKKYAAIM